MGMLDWVDPTRNAFVGLLRGEDRAGIRNKLVEALMNQPKPFDKSAIDGEAMLNNALNAGPSGLLGKIVYHGSPHKFDRFDASKIGTGEGAQAYGHGLYFADAHDVAQSYTKGGGAFQKSSPVPNVMIGDKWAQTMPRDSVESQAATIFANDLFGATIPEKVKKLRSAKMEPVADFLEKNADQFRLSNGEFYKADLPDEWIPKMLDWDNSIPEATRQAISKPMMEKFGSGASGGQGLNQWKQVVWEFKNAGSKQPEIDAARFLQENGIPGIRYLDGGSRGAGQGSYNYVVFPGLEDKVKILERNGVPLNGLLGLGAK